MYQLITRLRLIPKIRNDKISLQVILYHLSYLTIKLYKGKEHFYILYLLLHNLQWLGAYLSFKGLYGRGCIE